MTRLSVWTRQTISSSVLLAGCFALCLVVALPAIAGATTQADASSVQIVPRTQAAPAPSQAAYPIVPRQKTQPLAADQSGIEIVPGVVRPGGALPQLAPDAVEPPAQPQASTVETPSAPSYYPAPYRTFYGRYGVRFNLWWRRVPQVYYPYQFSLPPFYPPYYSYPRYYSNWTLAYPY